jgi:GxxExxY protein
MKRFEGKELDFLTQKILNAAFSVHSALGPGLLESAYEACLAHVLRLEGLTVERQKTLPVQFGEVLVEAGYRIDLLVNESVVIEVKSVSRIAPIHKAQALTYLKLAELRVALLLNFNVVRLKQGIVRLVHDFPDDPRTNLGGSRRTSAVK